MLSLRAAAHTDIGKVRQENEDRLLCDQEYLLFGVADGVGGLPGGGEAAQLTLEIVSGDIHAHPVTTKPDLTLIVHHANAAVSELGRSISPSMGIGTTLSFGCIRDGVLSIAHVGDSRAYVLSGATFTSITEDHSVENEARLRRAKGEVIYFHSANRNALTRCIGQPGSPEVDLVARPLVVGERYLFCTDGITRLVRDSELGEIMGRAADPAAALHEMIELAVRRGGPDNCTGVIFFIDSL